MELKQLLHAAWQLMDQLQGQQQQLLVIMPPWGCLLAMQLQRQ
jgi:hypothetical protein